MRKGDVGRCMGRERGVDLGYWRFLLVVAREFGRKGELK